LAWCGGVAAALALLGLGGYLLSVGLDDASKWAGVLGLFATLAGLVVSVAGLRRQRAETGAHQTVQGGDVTGGIVQVSGAGNVRIRQRSPALPERPPSPGGPAPNGPGQSVSGDRVTGSVSQVRDVTGDTDVEHDS